MSIPEMTLTMAEISDLDLSETVLAIANLQAEIERLRVVEADARRYRWLRVNFVVSAARGGYNDLIRQLAGETSSPHTGQVMDSVIDAGMAASRSTGAADVGED